MTINAVTLLRVLNACDEVAVEEPEPLVSFVFQTADGSSGQIFLKWREGKSLREYLKDPALHGKLSLYHAAYSRIVDHRNVKRRLIHVLQPGDELRFIRTASHG